MDWFTDGGPGHFTPDEITLLAKEKTVVLAYLREHGPCFITELYDKLCNKNFTAEAICYACWCLIERRAVLLTPDLHLEATDKVPIGTLHG